MPQREQFSHKGTFGKVLNFAGSDNYIGAAYLSSLAVLKIGAGYVALASDSNVILSVSKLLPEAVFIKRKKAIDEINKYSVVLIGCGIGQRRQTKFEFKKIINSAYKYNLPTIIDADGLNILSELNTKKINLPQKLVITPHPFEAARLLGVNSDEILDDLTGSAKKLSEKYNCVTVLKTHRTIICSKNSDMYINEHGNSALAKAGTGDVLAGIISGLLAQGMDLFEAAKLGVYLHSRAGEIASEDLTEYSVLASDIPKYLPNAIKEIL